MSWDHTSPPPAAKSRDQLNVHMSKDPTPMPSPPRTHDQPLLELGPFLLTPHHPAKWLIKRPYRIYILSAYPLCWLAAYSPFWKYDVFDHSALLKAWRLLDQRVPDSAGSWRSFMVNASKSSRFLLNFLLKVQIVPEARIHVHLLRHAPRCWLATESRLWKYGIIPVLLKVVLGYPLKKFPILRSFKAIRSKSSRFCLHFC
jgi:hypothetical protein